MYCPICLKDSLELNQSGIVNIVINGKKMDNGRFLYNCASETNEQILINFENKVEEFLKWYSKFQNAGEIQNVEICSNNFICVTGCVLKAAHKFSVIGHLLNKKDVHKIITEKAKKYNLSVKIVEN